MPEQYVPYSAAWFTPSLINAGLAQGKGRSGLNWWLGSLVAGPFATLLIVVWPALQPGQPEFRPGTMNRTQAVIIGLLVLVVVFGILGLNASNQPGGANGLHIDGLDDPIEHRDAPGSLRRAPLASEPQGSFSPLSGGAVPR